MSSKKDIIARLNREYAFIPAYIFEDPRLNNADICLISALYSYTRPGEDNRVSLNRSEVLAAASLEESVYYPTLQRLQEYGWVIVVEEKGEEAIYQLSQPDREKQIGDRSEPGSRIARAWSRYFGTRLIKHDDLEDLKEFVTRYGMEEELVLEVMDYSGSHAQGDPFSYARAILVNLVRQGVLTASEFEKGDIKHDRQVQKDYRGKEKRVRRERPRDELEADGYK